MSQSLNDIALQKEQGQKDQPPDFSDVFQEYERPIYNYLLRMTQNQVEAEDLTQETFIRVHRSLPTFRGESSLSTWLYRIATNVSLDHFRRSTTQQAKVALPLEETKPEGEWADEAPPSPEQRAAQAEMSACVEGFIQRLPPDYRAVLVLHDLQGLKNREIAEALDIPLSTVKIRLHRARNKLREALDTGCDTTHDERNILVCEPKVKDGEENER
jgi:RNA polymerase sigma-70 factor (ECF subfamily)